MLLDPSTLIFINVANLLVMGGALPIIMGQGLSTAAARGRRSLILNAGAWICLLISTEWNGVLPDLLLSTLAMALICASQWALYRALENWLGRRPLRRALLVLAWLMPTGYALSFSSYEIRVGWANLLLAAQMLIVARACLYPMNRDFGRASWRYPLFGCLVVMAGFTSARGILGAWFTELYPYFRAPTPVNLAALLAANMALVLGAMTILGAWREEAEQQLHRLAITDPLTGLLNRNGWAAQTGHVLRRAQRHKQPLSLLLLDLDHFKQINDVHGHETGDEVLRRFARVLQQCLRTGDVCARVGGEEMCVLLFNADTAAARAFDERVRARLAQHAAMPLPVGFSAGHTLCRDDETTLEQAMARADAALYRAKGAGRGQMVSDCDAT
ncbi:diguanylate cyclase [Hylemonella gracilis str. Niagara R]|uniref:diguanylate cyclase n=1 Tax=Hylemonella gracilis str. Niagara R TaxID=1458275 RepID=A0A016XKP5_9BURK|nr:GGDEF domain-containing protein [Hylemonella gracilis]EYC52112.1 diguanylate cyclase [Hylemonella gracilis str. Niagara R]